MSTDLTTTVLLFGWVREYIGVPEIIIPSMHGKTVKQLKEYVTIQFQLGDRLKDCMIAVNHTYASNEMVISTHDEIALIPPVSGG